MLPRLVSLYISNTHDWGAVDFHQDVSKLPSLKEIVLEGFAVPSNGVEGFFAVPTLETVVMDGVTLSALPDVNSMIALRVLQLTDNFLEGTAPSFANLANLERLKIGGEKKPIFNDLVQQDSCLQEQIT